MRLQLADAGDDLRTIYDRLTGQALSCDMPLANRAQRRAKRDIRKSGKLRRLQRRVDARYERQEDRLTGRRGRQQDRIDKRYKGGDDEEEEAPDGGGEEGGGEDEGGEEMNDSPFSIHNLFTKREKEKQDEKKPLIHFPKLRKKNKPDDKKPLIGPHIPKDKGKDNDLIKYAAIGVGLYFLVK